MSDFPSSLSGSLTASSSEWFGDSQSASPKYLKLSGSGSGGVGDSEESEEEDRALSEKGRTNWTLMAVKRTVIRGYLSYTSVDT